MARRLALATLGVVLAGLVVVVAGWWRSRLDAPSDPTTPPRPVPSVASATLDEATSRLRRGDFGIAWTPAPGDGAILGETVGVDGSAGTTGAPGFGLGLAIEGDASVTLPGEHGPARFDAELDATGFGGSVILVFDGAMSRVAVELAPNGDLVLRADDAILATGRASRPDGPFVLGLAVAGGLASASLDGQRIAEGRLDRAPRGACSLRLVGHGSLRVRRLQVTNLAE